MTVEQARTLLITSGTRRLSKREKWSPLEGFQVKIGNLLYFSRIFKCFAMQASFSGMFFMQSLILIFKLF